jgi:hypothetical protein
VPGTQCTAAETHEHDALIFRNALTATFVGVFIERSLPPREPARAMPSKKGSENKQTRNAVFNTNELVNQWMKMSAMKWKQASRLLLQFRLVRVGQVKHGRRNTRNSRKSQIML